MFALRGRGTSLISGDSIVRADVQARRAELRSRIVNPLPNFYSNKYSAVNAQHVANKQPVPYNWQQVSLLQTKLQQSPRPLLGARRWIPSFTMMECMNPSEAEMRPANYSLCLHTLSIVVVHKGMVHIYILGPWAVRSPA